MRKASIYNAISGTCLLIGVGGIGGACDTGKGYFLSIIIFLIGVLFEMTNDYEKKSLNLERKKGKGSRKNAA